MKNCPKFHDNVWQLPTHVIILCLLYFISLRKETKRGANALKKFPGFIKERSDDQYSCQCYFQYLIKSSLSFSKLSYVRLSRRSIAYCQYAIT